MNIRNANLQLPENAPCCIICCRENLAELSGSPSRKHSCPMGDCLGGLTWVLVIAHLRSWVLWFLSEKRQALVNIIWHIVELVIATVEESITYTNALKL